MISTEATTLTNAAGDELRVELDCFNEPAVPVVGLRMQGFRLYLNGRRVDEPEGFRFQMDDFDIVVTDGELLRVVRTPRS